MLGYEIKVEINLQYNTKGSFTTRRTRTEIHLHNHTPNLVTKSKRQIELQKRRQIQPQHKFTSKLKGRIKLQKKE